MSIQEIEAQFRELNGKFVKDYEETLREYHEKEAHRQHELKEAEKEARDIIRASGVDIDRLDALENKYSENTQKFLEDVRPKLVDRPAKLAEDFKKHSIYPAVSSQAGSIIMIPYAASLLAPDKKTIGHVPGETGNPWVLPSNPQEINIAAASTGSGWGCWAQGIPLPIQYKVWFTFVPEQTGSWFLWTYLSFHGFYILRADDSWYNCKSARISTEVSLNVYQYFWQGRRTFPLINRNEDNVNTYGFYDDNHMFDHRATLQAGDRVWVTAEISIQAFGLGSGSYAEINFSDGLANYIRPVVLIAGRA